MYIRFIVGGWGGNNGQINCPNLIKIRCYIRSLTRYTVTCCVASKLVDLTYNFN